MHRRFDIRVCRGPVCAGEREADAVHERLAELLAARGLGAVVELERQSCFGRCRLGPNVHVGERLAPELLAAPNPPRKLSAFYNGVGPEDADEIVAAHVLGGRAVERLIYRVPFAAATGPMGDGDPHSGPDDEPGKDPHPSADVAPDPR